MVRVRPGYACSTPRRRGAWPGSHTPSGARRKDGSFHALPVACPKLVDDFDDIAQMLPRRLRKHAVTQVENVPGPAGGLPQDLQGALTDDVAGCQQHRRIEVPLDATVVADPRPCLGQGNPDRKSTRLNSSH